MSDDDRPVETERVDLAVKVAGLGLMGLVSVALLGTSLALILFGRGWAKLVGLAALFAGVGLWSLTFWLASGRPKGWVSPDRPPSCRRKR